MGLVTPHCKRRQHKQVTQYQGGQVAAAQIKEKFLLVI
jgi:hypothetical protein